MAVKRLLAVVVAIALIAGAVVIRRFLDDGGELSLGGASSTIYCDSALADACRSVFDTADLKVEAPGVTLARFLDDTDDGPVVWIAADLWFDILASEQQRVRASAEVTSTADPIVHTPLVLATVADDVCDPPSWECIASIDGTLGTGGDLDSSVGLLIKVQLAATVLGRPTFASNDAEFRGWESRLSIDVEPAQSESALLGKFLNFPAGLDAVAVTNAAVVQVERDVQADRPTDAGPELEVGAVALNGARLPGALDDLASALVDDGWTGGAAPDAERPSGGAMQALRS